MRLDSIVIQGLLRFADRVALNFRELPPGVVAFVGENGEGKTTMLEAPVATWFRSLPSRADKELVDYVQRTDGFTEVAFELEGQGFYRSRLNLDGPHRKSEASLSRTLPDGQVVFLNDGKLKSYDAAILQLLPPKALMLASVFAAQNRFGAFTDLDRKGRAELFAALLGLNDMVERGTWARNAAGLVQAEIDKLTARRDGLTLGGDVEEDLERRAQQVQASGGQLEADKRELGHEIRNIEQRLAIVAEAAQQHAVATARLAQNRAENEARTREQERADQDFAQVAVDLARDLGAAETDLDRRLAAFEAELADASAYDKEIVQADAALKAVQDDVATRIAANRQVLEEAVAIRTAADRLVTLDAELRTLRVNLDQAADEASTLLSNERAVQEGLKVIEDAERDLQTVQRALDVPCGAGEQFLSCRTLTDAAALRGKVPGLEAILARRPAAEEALAEVQRAIAMNAEAMADYRQRIKTVEQARAATAPIAAKLEPLKVAEAKIASHEERGRTAVATHVTACADAATRAEERRRAIQARRSERIAEHEAQLEALVRRADERRQVLGATIRDLAEKLAAIDDEFATLTLTIAATAQASATAAAEQARLTETRAKYESVLTSLATVEAERQELARRVAEVRARLEGLARVDSLLSSLRTDHVEWLVLAKALGRDGLPVLEIDAAGPTVSTYANQLLEACYGTRFTLELVTQVERASKSKSGEAFKDAFEIHVFDAERGGDPRELNDLSGGEKVIVEECLRSAIALVVNQRSPIPLRTLWRDECTGALDVNNGPRYLAMLRKLQELGGYHHVIAIVHNPEWAALADAQVRFAGGQVSIELPPYGREAAA